jgi:hypothetical protein
VSEVEGYLLVRAPFDGVITERNVHPGALVGPATASGATPLLKLEQTARLRLIVPVPEKYVAGMTEGARVDFSVPAFPGETFSGTIARISHSIDVKTRTMPVESDFIRKVTHGAPILMGTPPMLYRGRMPVFYYLSEQEAADVYLYLTTYPPSEPEDKSTPIVLSKQNAASSGDPPVQSSASGSKGIASSRREPLQASSEYTVRTVALLVGVALFVSLLLAGGLGFTIYEFKRLSAESDRRRIARADAYILSFPMGQQRLRSRVADEGNLRRIAR